MKRPKLGDVYYVKVPNGYKIFQWAYDVPRKGDYIRVFDGLYEFVPENIGEIVAGPHNYILPFDVKRLYRVGLSQLIGNYAVPEEYPFPKYMIRADIDSKTRKVSAIRVMATTGRFFRIFNAGSLEDLPSEYRDITLINSWIGPAWLFYLFDINFNMSRLELYSPGTKWEEDLKDYIALVEPALAREEEKKLQRKKAREEKKKQEAESGSQS